MFYILVTHFWWRGRVRAGGQREGGRDGKDGQRGTMREGGGGGGEAGQDARVCVMLHASSPLLSLSSLRLLPSISANGMNH